jgi:hypothetical protein
LSGFGSVAPVKVASPGRSTVGVVAGVDVVAAATRPLAFASWVRETATAAPATPTPLAVAQSTIAIFP